MDRTASETHQTAKRWSVRVRVAMLAAGCWGLCGIGVQEAVAAELPVKVFVLAGQSNMEGKAPIRCSTHRQSPQQPSRSTRPIETVMRGRCERMCSSPMATGTGR